MFFKKEDNKSISIQLQKYNASLQVTYNNGKLQLNCKQADFINNLIKVLGIFEFEGYMEFIDLVNNKENAGYQDFSVFFEDGVVEYYLGAPAGQVSELLFFEVLVYFLIGINQIEKANIIFKEHLSELPEGLNIRKNIDLLIEVKDSLND